MSARSKKLVVILAMAILFNFSLTNIRVAVSDDTGGKIDVFTQNEPYSGRGPNMPSDAFGPQEVVILYALVTYNEIVVQNLQAAFNVNTPHNTSFTLTSKTNASGIATVSFAIPENETEIFGEWLVIANVLISGEVFQDTLIFKVDWVVKLISVRAINENLTDQRNFGIGGDVGLEITLRSIAMSLKKATIAMVIKDELNFVVNGSEIQDFKVQPNEKIAFLYCKLYIPKSAHVGEAQVFVSALTAPANGSGIPYCPAVSAEFFIEPYESMMLIFNDVSVVNAVPSTRSVEVGQPVTASAVVQNEGTEVESFNVNASYDSVPIGSLEVIALAPYSSVVLNFTLNTSSVGVGNYTIAVSIPYLANETDLTDNVFVDGTIEIKPHVVTRRHYLRVATEPSGVTPIPGEGWYDEYANVSLTASIAVLISLGARYKFSHWDVDGVSQGIGAGSISVFMNNNHTATAHYVLQYYLTVKTNPIGVATISGEGWYNRSAHVPLNAPEATGYNFEHWDVDGVSQGVGVNSIIMNMNAPHTATAHYVQITTYTLTIIVTEGGTTSPAPGTYSHAGGSTVQVTAIPNANYILDHWELDNIDVGSANPYGVLMNNNHTLKAVFAPAPAGWFVPEWFWWLLLLLLLLLLIFLVIIWLYRRRRDKESERAFYSGWTAWYYCYDLRSGMRRF